MKDTSEGAHTGDGASGTIAPIPGHERTTSISICEQSITCARGVTSPERV